MSAYGIQTFEEYRKTFFDTPPQTPEEEANYNYWKLREQNQKFIEQYYNQKKEAQEQKELEKAVLKEVDKQLDAAVDKALNDIFKDFLK